MKMKFGGERSISGEPGTWRTDPDVAKAKEALDEATLRARRSGETFRSTGAGAELHDAYEAWMTARAKAGDPFARDLGYGRTDS